MEQISLEDINLDMIPINVLQDVDGKQRRGYAHTFLNRRNTDEYNRSNSNYSSINLYRICILHT